MRSTQNSFSTKNVVEKLLIHARKLIVPLNLFNSMDLFVEKTVLSNHKLELINKILEKYFQIRLYHEGVSAQDKIQHIRNYRNRIVLFKNQ